MEHLPSLYIKFNLQPEADQRQIKVESIFKCSLLRPLLMWSTNCLVACDGSVWYAFKFPQSSSP